MFVVALQYLAMDPEMDKAFSEITDSLEYGVLGIREYDTVGTELVNVHQHQLERHLEELAGSTDIDLMSLSDEMVRELHRRIWNDFVMLGVFDIDDEIIAAKGGLALLIDARAQCHPLLLSDDRRFHGKVVRPTAIQAPRLDTVRPHEGKIGLDHDSIVYQPAVALEIEKVSVEEPLRRFTESPDSYKVFIPLCYEQMMIKRRQD